MRCAAPVPERALTLRSRESPVDGRCLRSGKVKIHGRCYCRQHAPIWRELWETHDSIIQRIRDL